MGPKLTETTPRLHPTLPWLVAGLAAVPAVRRVILFGSWARMVEPVEDAPTLLDIGLVRLDAADAGLRTVVAREGMGAGADAAVAAFREVRGVLTKRGP